MDKYSDASICKRCWPEGFDNEHALLTYRGPWMYHKSILCDSRKVFLKHYDKHQHCVCDRERIFNRDFGVDNETVEYGGMKHELSEVTSIMDIDSNWEHYILECVKKNPNIDPKLDSLWLIALLVGSVARIQFNLAPSPLQYVIAAASVVELSSNYKEWELSRDSVLEKWELAKNLMPKDLSAFCLRNLFEYLCGRSLYRVTQSESFKEFPYHVKHFEDPLLKQIVGGNWSGLTYMSMDVIHSKDPLELKNAGWSDLAGSTFNNWASFHRDFSDGTINNTLHYYRNTGYSFSDDLYYIFESCLFESGSSIRSILSSMDLNDLNSRNKFSENYFHCQAKGFTPIKPKSNQLVSRLTALYGFCPVNSLSSYDTYCYILTREKHKNSNLYSSRKYPSAISLNIALIDCLGESKAQFYYPKIVCEIQNALELHLQSNKASLVQDHDKITQIGSQYRLLRMTQWSMELNEKLPIGANLIIAYHVYYWFYTNMTNVDQGCQRLADIKFQL